MTCREGTSSWRTCTTLRMTRWISLKSCANLRNLKRIKTATSLTDKGRPPTTTSKKTFSVSTIETEASSMGSRMRRKKLTIWFYSRKIRTTGPCNSRISLWRIVRISPNLPWKKWIAPWWTKTVPFTTSESIIRTTLPSKFAKPPNSWKSRRKNLLLGSKKLMLTKSRLFSCWTPQLRRVQLNTPKCRETSL